MIRIDGGHILDVCRRVGRAGGAQSTSDQNDQFADGQPVMRSKGMPSRRRLMQRMVNSCKCRRARQNDDECAAHHARRRHNYGAALHIGFQKKMGGRAADGSTATRLDDAVANNRVEDHPNAEGTSAFGLACNTIYHARLQLDRMMYHCTSLITMP
ncbi:hypothetical protein B0H17DRAFT_1145652 [Mycena rosella]|uniref:Uncharacterized protein n=1 Tax=Mycena rosella TaxID=1033263 RepID=A0AAD7CQJ1_MYCRO|nr:hypothetical protein B0H17DRAFT_1145652 [Mycena rosella]